MLQKVSNRFYDSKATPSQINKLSSKIHPKNIVYNLDYIILIIIMLKHIEKYARLHKNTAQYKSRRCCLKFKGENK